MLFVLNLIPVIILSLKLPTWPLWHCIFWAPPLPLWPSLLNFLCRFLFLCIPHKDCCPSSPSLHSLIFCAVTNCILMTTKSVLSLEHQTIQHQNIQLHTGNTYCGNTAVNLTSPEWSSSLSSPSLNPNLCPVIIGQWEKLKEGTAKIQKCFRNYKLFSIVGR